MLYKILSKRKKKIKLSSSDQYRFYVENSPKFSSVLSYYHLSTGETNPFKIIQANIIIKALMNKELIESNLERISLDATQNTEVREDEFIKKSVWKLLEEENAPYFSLEKSRIYVPIFSHSLNIIYNEECGKLLEFPYDNLVKNPKSSCVDLFDTYNFKLYDSPFTSLILIKEDKTSSAFYDPDFEMVYIINNQGRLDLEISLYDKYLKHVEKHHTLSKIQELMEKFYDNDYHGFVNSLYKNKFISKKTFNYIKNKKSLTIIRQDKIYSKGKFSDEVL